MGKTIAIRVSSSGLAQECIEELNKYGVPVYFSGLIMPPNRYICICYDIDTFEYLSSFAAPEINSDTKEYNYCDIEFFKLPTEIQEAIVERTKQKNCIGFIINLCAGDSTGGFTWDSSEEGDGFWRSIIEDRQFDVFFTKYPKNHEAKVSDCPPHYTSLSAEDIREFNKLAKQLYADCATNINDYSKILKDESRLQEQEVNLSRRDGTKPVRFHGGKHQVRIASKHLSYQKAVGRG